MKTSIGLNYYSWFIAGLLLLCTLSQCELNERIEYYVANKGFIEAEVNGEPWHIDCSVPNELNDSKKILMTGMYFNDSNQLWESIGISFFNIPRDDTVYFSGNFKNADNHIEISFHTLYPEIDISAETFNILNDSTNFVKLFVKGNYREIEGYFEFVMIKNLFREEEDSPMPDTLRFKNGYFRNDLK